MYAPHELGKRGEDLAVEYLELKGYAILARNYRYSYSEIDIVAIDGQFLVIVEVKSRSSAYFGDPDEGVSSAQTATMARAGAQYQEEQNIDLEFRFDIISLVFNEDKLISMKHLEDAFHL